MKLTDNLFKDTVAEQRSEQWHMDRCGKFTSSRFAQNMAKPSTLTYKNEIARVAFERFTGKPAPAIPITYDMQRGIDLEDEGKQVFMDQQNCEIIEHGFCLHPDYDFVGGSPDGVLFNDTLFELKCPKYNTHISYLAANRLPPKYRFQAHGLCSILGLKEIIFVSYYPGLPMFIHNCPVDEQLVSELLDRLTICNADANKYVEYLETL